MVSRKILIAVGALALIGGAAAIAQTGDRGGGMGMGRGDGMDMGRGGDNSAEGGDYGGEQRRGWRRGRGDGDGFGRGRQGGRDRTLADIEERARVRFAAIDKNGDNVIDPSEIEARITARQGQRGAGRFGGGMMRRIDRDNDGKVTRAEVEAMLKRRFAQLDLNNDGRITDADLPPMMRGRNVLGTPPEGGRQGRGMMRLRGADTNKDGAVTFEEFAARAAGRFGMMDRNKDGAFDQADRDALRKAMVDYRVARFIHRFGPEADKARGVTRDQFLNAARERFAERDVNKDGVINREDRRGGGQR